MQPDARPLEVERMLEIPERALRELGDRLRAAELSPAFLARLARVGENLDDALRAPMRVWNARRMKEPAAVAARLFMLHDPVDETSARAVIGDPAPLLAGGLLERNGRDLSGRAHLALAADVFCLGDPPGTGGDAVPPLCGATLDLARAAMPGRGEPAAGRALDLGCGAGALALLLARSARRVAAVDVNPRAVAFTRANATLNGVRGLDVRAGDLFEPLAGQTFDRIVAQPPFLAGRPGARPSTFTHGGLRGDELPLRFLAEAAERLSPGGRAYVIADFPLFEGDSLERRVRVAVGAAPVDVLALQAPSKNLDEYCILHAAVEHPDLGPGFRDAATGQRDHLERVGVRGIALALVVLRRGSARAGAGNHAGTGGAPPWTSLLPVRHGSDVPFTPESIARLLAVRALASGAEQDLGGARLRVPSGARRMAQPMPDGAPPSLVVQPPAGFPEWPVVLDADAAAVLAAIDRSPTVDAAARAIAEERGASLEVARAEATKVAREMLVRGALTIAPDG